MGVVFIAAIAVMFLPLVLIMISKVACVVFVNFNLPRVKIMRLLLYFGTGVALFNFREIALRAIS